PKPDPEPPPAPKARPGEVDARSAAGGGPRDGLEPTSLPAPPGLFFVLALDLVLLADLLVPGVELLLLLPAGLAGGCTVDGLLEVAQLALAGLALVVGGGEDDVAELLLVEAHAAA